MNSAIIDNAGPDGIFGNQDDLPVSVVLVLATLTNPGNRHSGGTIISGGGIFHQPVSGTVFLRDGELHLRPQQSGVLMTSGHIVADAPFSQVSLYAEIRSSRIDNAEVRVNDLTVTPSTDLRFVTSSFAPTNLTLVVEGKLDVRGARLRLGDYSDQHFRFVGDYEDDANTLIDAHLSADLLFQTGDEIDVNARLVNLPLRAAGEGTRVRFNGIVQGNLNSLQASQGGTIVMTAGSTITHTSGLAAGARLLLAGDGRGTIEFAEGFRPIKSVADIDTDFVGVSNIELSEPVRWVTNHSENLPNFSAEYMAHEVPDSYPGSISFGVDGAAWQVKTNRQDFNQRLDIGASARLITDATPRLTPESSLALGRRPFGSSTLVGGTLLKEGSADLDVNGRLVRFANSTIDIAQGRVVMNNRTSEGSGRLDVRVRSGATLVGGNAGGTAGLIPGFITVEAGGHLSPGNDTVTGVLSVSGDRNLLELKTDSLFEPTLAGAIAGSLHDQLRVNGTVRLGDAGGQAILSPVLGYTPTLGDLLFLIDNDRVDPITGLFKSSANNVLTQGAILPLASTIDTNAYGFEISYTGDVASGAFSSPVGNDVVLRSVAVVPEPASMVLLFTLAAVCACVKTVRRRTARRPHGRAPLT